MANRCGGVKPVRPAPGTATAAMADRLARKPGGEEVDDEAWARAG